MLLRNERRESVNGHTDANELSLRDRNSSGRTVPGSPTNLGIPKWHYPRTLLLASKQQSFHLIVVTRVTHLDGLDVYMAGLL
jgi:hypothetical protein